MACFYLQLRRPGDDPTTGTAAAETVLSRRGLDEPVRLDGPGFRLLYYRKTLDPRPQMATGPDGEFALATGTFVYADLYGEPALQALLRDFTDDWTCLDRAYGQFALVVYRNGELHLATDRGGFHHIYHDTADTVFSNCFLAVCATVPRCTPEPLNIQERLICGAIHGPETIFREVVRVPPRQALMLVPDVVRKAKPPLPPVRHDLAAGDRDEALVACAEALVASLHPVAALWGDHLITPLTGGYDSRLLTAGLRAAGAAPDHLVYGPADHPDVVLSRRICEHHGWNLDHQDRDREAPPPPDEFADLIDRAFHVHDGRGITGVFDNGTDLASREVRAQGGRLYLAGSGGGIFREALDVGRHACTTDYVVHHRYARQDFSVLRAGFSWPRFAEHAASRMAVLFDPPTGRLENWQIHALFPRWRLRFWMSPDNQVNNLYAPALVPYTEPGLTELALGLPQHWRDDGRFEAGLINHLDPELASHQTVYGWAFDSPPPASARLRRWSKHAVPGFLRRRWQSRILAGQVSREVVPNWLRGAHLQAVLGDGPRLMDEFVDLDRIRGVKQLNLALSLELLLRRFA